jgi:hypothetical protein
MKTSRVLSIVAWLLLALFSAGLRAQTAAEPTVHQIYQAASGGDLAGAQSMIDEVIRRHPQSAKAHYVKAELATRAHDGATARSELQTAEKLAPGLPFAKPEAVSALRSQVERLGTAGGRTPAAVPQHSDARRMGGSPVAGAGGGFPLGGLLLVAVLVGGVFLLLRRRRPASYDAPPDYAAPPAGPYARDDAFGRGYGPGYPPPGYGPYGPAPAQGGMGSALARGLGTGLAIGAGAVAAQEIGRRMFEHGQDGSAHLQDAPPLGHGGDNAHTSLAQDAGLGALGGGVEPDLGGQDFGIADNGGWDDAGGGLDDLGGGDWDR